MTDVSVGFRPPCWCPSGWAPTWRLHTNLYKFGKKVSPHISHKKNCCDLKLGESLCIFTFFRFSESGLYLLNGLIFILVYFEWRDTENQQDCGKISSRPTHEPRHTHPGRLDNLYKLSPYAFFVKRAPSPC